MGIETQHYSPHLALFVFVLFYLSFPHSPAYRRLRRLERVKQQVCSGMFLP